MDPNDIIDTIVDAIDYAEMARDTQGLIKARRLLNNDLRQAIDQYVQAELERVFQEENFPIDVPQSPYLHEEQLLQETVPEEKARL